MHCKHQSQARLMQLQKIRSRITIQHKLTVDHFGSSNTLQRPHLTHDPRKPRPHSRHPKHRTRHLTCPDPQDREIYPHDPRDTTCVLSLTFLPLPTFLIIKSPESHHFDLFLLVSPRSTVIVCLRKRTWNGPTTYSLNQFSKEHLVKVRQSLQQIE